MDQKGPHDGHERMRLASSVQYRRRRARRALRKRRVKAGLSVLVTLAVATAAAGVAAPFKVTTGRADDRVSVNVEKGNATVSIRSPFGISHAILQEAGTTWP